MRFNVSSFMLRSLIYLDLNFVQSDKYRWICIFLHADPPVRPALLVEDAFFFPLYVFGLFAKDQVFIGVWVYFWIFDSIPLIDLSVSVLSFLQERIS